MTKDEALRLALEALENITSVSICEATHHAKKDRHLLCEDCPNEVRHLKAITALKAALEVPEEKYIYGTPLLDAMTGRNHTPEDVKKIMEPWSPVSIGVDVTKEGAHVVGIYALDKDTSQIFYAKHHPALQRTWVGLTKEERHEISMANRPYCADIMAAHEEELKRRNT